MNNERIERLKSTKQQMLAHLDALNNEEFKLWSLAHDAGAVGTLEPDADVCEAIHDLDDAIHNLRKELMSYMNDRIDGEEKSEA